MTQNHRLKWRPGLATRLYIAIGGAVAFVLLSSVVAWIAFVQLGDQQREIASLHLPAITHSLQLAERASQIASVAPKLLVVDSDKDRQDVIDSLGALEREIQSLLTLLSTNSMHSQATDDEIRREAELTETVRENGHNFSELLRDLGRAETQRAALERELRRLTGSAVTAHQRLRELIVPILDDRTFFMAVGYTSLDQQAPAPLSERFRDEAILDFGALFDLEAEANLMTVLLAEMRTIEEAARLTPLIERFQASRDRFATALARASDLDAADSVRTNFEALAAAGATESGIPDLQRQVLTLRRESVATVDQSRQIASGISTSVKQIVEIKRGRSEASVSTTERIVSGGQQLLLVLNGIALIGAIVISRVYIKRSFTTPVVELTAAAEAFEDGQYEDQSLAATRERTDELGRLARTFSSMAEEVQARTEKLDALVAERTRQLNEKNQELAKSLERIEAELEMAKRMQLSILPRRVPDRLQSSIFANMQAAREVGGDFYDFIELGDNRFGLAIADVSDKGVPAAFMMAVSYTKLRSLALRGLSPGTVMELLNEDLSEDNESAMFVTIFYGVIDLEQGTLTYVNAGHDRPVVIQSAGDCEMLPSSRGVPVGVMPGYRYSELSHALQPGDTLFCYTDGITEAFNPGNEEFSLKRLVSLIDGAGSVSPELLCTRVIGAVKTHAAGAPQSDDITCVAFKFDPALHQQRENLAETEASYQLAPDPAEIAVLAEKMMGFGAATQIPEALMRKINLALDELLTNTMMHGSNNDQPPNIGIHVKRLETGVEVVIEDDAPAFNPLEQGEPDLDIPLEDRPIGGLGIHIVRSLIDEVGYSRSNDKNRVTLFKQIEA